jgi:TRAP-type C4-dicarboxylate transport system permease small subunit
MLHVLQRLADTLREAALRLSSVILACQIVIVGIVVAGRYLFDHTPSWGEELALLCMVWFSLLSAVVAARDGKHIRIRILFDLFPPSVRRVLTVFYVIFSLAFCAVLVVFGARLMALTATSQMPGSGLSRAWLYGALPVSGLLLFVTIPLSAHRLFPNQDKAEDAQP